MQGYLSKVNLEFSYFPFNVSWNLLDKMIFGTAIWYVRLRVSKWVNQDVESGLQVAELSTGFGWYESLVLAISSIVFWTLEIAMQISDY